MRASPRCARGGCLAILAATLLASPATAKPKLPACPPPGPQLFIAPMGQPFRAAAGAPDPVGQWFAAADADHDGRLTVAEFAADADRFFATLDLDRDGEIIPDEVSAYERNVAPEIQLFAARGFGREAERREQRAKQKRFVYGGPLGAGRWSFLNLPEPVSAADADLNRGVSRDEFRVAATDRFRRIDSAGRGALTLDTLPKTPAQAARIDCIAPPPGSPPPAPRAGMAPR